MGERAGWACFCACVEKQTIESTVTDANRRSIVIGDEQRFVVNGLEKLIVGAHLPHAVVVGKMSFGSVGIGAREHAPHLLQADAIFVQCRGIQLDADPR